MWSLLSWWASNLIIRGQLEKPRPSLWIMTDMGLWLRLGNPRHSYDVVVLCVNIATHRWSRWTHVSFVSLGSWVAHDATIPPGTFSTWWTYRPRLSRLPSGSLKTNEMLNVPKGINVQPLNIYIKNRQIQSSLLHIQRIDWHHCASKEFFRVGLIPYLTGRWQVQNFFDFYFYTEVEHFLSTDKLHIEINQTIRVRNIQWPYMYSVHLGKSLTLSHHRLKALLRAFG